MAFVPKEKGNILAIAGQINHLHIICTKQFFYPETGSISVLAVNISSVKQGVTYDKACILRAGDHPFIKHDSYVRYRDAVVMKVDRIQAGIQSGEIEVLEDVTDEIFQKVLIEFEKSDFTKGKIKKLLNRIRKN